MGSEWNQLRLDEVTQIIVDCPHSTPKWTNHGVIVLRNQNIRDGKLDLSSPSYTNEEGYKGRIKRGIPSEGDIVFTREAPMGEVCQIPRGLRCCLGQRMVLLRANTKIIDSKFLLFTLQSPYLQHQISWNEGTGTTVSNIRIPNLKAFRIPTPPVPKQKAIAHILGSLDDKIELNRQMNSTLESMAQAMFKSWFVDFDPVIDNAMAAGNPIPEPLKTRAENRKRLGDQRKTLPQEIQQQFPSRFVLSEKLGWIPEGWEVSTVGDQVKTAGGGTPSTKDNSYWDGGVHAFCTPKDMSRLNSIVMTDTERHLTDAGVNKISSGQLKTGVVLMSSRAPIGYLAISNIPVSVNQGVIAMIPSGKYGSMYLHLWAHFNMGQITDRANGSTFMEISKKNFRPIPFLVPADKILKFFNDQSHSIYLKLLSLSENVVELTNLRDTLLPKLISGQLRLPDFLIDKFAEQANSHDAEQIISEAI